VASETAVLNANYLLKRLAGSFEPAFGETCMHEFVLSLEKLKEETGVSALDFAKSLIDLGMHPPTMYFPLTVHEALMVEPTETESKQTLDEAAEAFLALYRKAFDAPEEMKAAPKAAVIGRPDEVAAARSPRLRYE
jgi:glycine dehydrogenase subunit 2